MALSAGHIERILEAAIQAPSGDNWQPWRFRVSGNRPFVYRDPERDRSPYNVLGKADLIALGGAIENAGLMAGELGYAAMPAYFPDPQKPSLAAALTLEPHPGPPDPLASPIGNRMTNRLPYRRPDLSPETWARIIDLVGQDLASRVTLRTGVQVLRRLAEALVVADRILFGNPQFHGSLFGAIRWTSREAQELRDGLPLNTLGLTAMEAFGFRLLRSWRLVRFLSPLGLQAAMARRSQRLILRSSGLVCVNVPSTDDRDFVLAGRLAQRVWLAFTVAGLAVQPVTGLLWLALRMDLLGGEGLSPQERTEVSQAWQALRKEFGLEEGWRPAVLFRVGFARPPRARAPRRPVADCTWPGEAGTQSARFGGTETRRDVEE